MTVFLVFDAVTLSQEFGPVAGLLNGFSSRSGRLKGGCSHDWLPHNLIFAGGYGCGIEGARFGRVVAHENGGSAGNCEVASFAADVLLAGRVGIVEATGAVQLRGFTAQQRRHF